MKTFITLILMLPLLALADTGPFGTVIGKTTLAELRSITGSSSPLQSVGENAWNGGPMYVAQGSGFGIAGLLQVTFIFDTRDRLAAAVLTLDKRRYPEIKQVLASEYRLVSDQAPFVGNQESRFRQGPVTITAAAPHMSFEMTVTYAHDSFADAMKAGQQAREQQQRSRERAAF